MDDLEAARAAVVRARERLESAGARDELLGTLVIGGCGATRSS